MTQGEQLGFLAYDSREYLDFAQTIRAGGLFSRLDDSSPPGLYLRSPGYPVILAVAQTIAPHDLLIGLKVIHALLLISALALLCFSLSGVLGPLATTLALVPSTLKIADFFRSNVTEWSAFCMILVLFASLIHAERAKRAFCYFWVGLACSLLILIKPGFIFLLGILGIALLVRQKPKHAAHFVVGLFPLLLWMTINLHRTGTFAIEHQKGFAFFYIASLLGPAYPEATDSDLTRRCFAEILAHRTELTDSELRNSRNIASQGKKNNQGIIYTLRDASDYSWTELDVCMRAYSYRSISSHVRRYITHLWYGIQVMRHSLGELLLFICLLLWCRRDPRYPILLAVGVCAWCLHVGNVAVVLASQVMLPRYFLLTAVCTWIPITLGIAMVITRRFTKNDLRANGDLAF